MKPKKWMSRTVLVFVLVLNGCSVNGLLFESKNTQPVVIIDYPPNRITYEGFIYESDMKHMKEVLTILSREEYIDHVHQFPMTFTSEVTHKDTEVDHFGVHILGGNDNDE